MGLAFFMSGIFPDSIVTNSLYSWMEAPWPDSIGLAETSIGGRIVAQRPD